MKLLDQVRQRVRFKHYSLSTDESYVGWIKQFILYHNIRQTSDMSAQDVEAFVTYLAVARRVSSSTQNQALSAILFLYLEVLQLDLPWVGAFSRSKVPKRLSVVLTQAEVQALLTEAVRIAPSPYGLIVRSSKGDKDRVTVLPVSLSTALAEQVQRYCKRAAQDVGIAKLVSPHTLRDLAERFLYASPLGRGEIKPYPFSSTRVALTPTTQVLA